MVKQFTVNGQQSTRARKLQVTSFGLQVRESQQSMVNSPLVVAGCWLLVRQVLLGRLLPIEAGQA